MSNLEVARALEEEERQYLRAINRWVSDLKTHVGYNYWEGKPWSDQTKDTTRHYHTQLSKAWTDYLAWRKLREIERGTIDE